MTDHEMILLRAANEVLGYGVPWYRNTSTGFYCIHPVRRPDNGETLGNFQHATLADALTALLTDLGADVPEWPSEDRMIQWRKAIAAGAADPEALPLPEYLALRGGS